MIPLWAGALLLLGGIVIGLLLAVLLGGIAARRAQRA